MKTLFKLLSTTVIAASLTLSPAAFAHTSGHPHKTQTAPKKAPKKAVKKNTGKVAKKNHQAKHQQRAR